MATHLPSESPFPQLPSYREIYETLANSTKEDAQNKVDACIRSFLTLLENETTAIPADQSSWIQKIKDTLEKSALVSTSQHEKIKRAYQQSLFPKESRHTTGTELHQTPPLPAEIEPGEQPTKSPLLERDITAFLIQVMVKFSPPSSSIPETVDSISNLPCHIEPLPYLKELLSEMEKYRSNGTSSADQKQKEIIMQLKIVVELLSQGVANPACTIAGDPRNIARHLRKLTGLVRSFDNKSHQTNFKDLQKPVGSLIHKILETKKPLVYTTEFAHKFKTLNQLPAPSVVASQIKQYSKLGQAVLGNFTKAIRGKTRYDANQFSFYENDLRWRTYFAAEHLGQGPLAGMYSYPAIELTLELIKHIDTPSPALERIQAGLEFALELWRKTASWLPNSITLHNIAEHLIEAVASLKVNESLPFSANSWDHGMLMVVTCTGWDSNGKKVYKIVHHNEGDGVDKYHYSKVDRDGRRMYQTALEIEDITAENLISYMSPFFLIIKNMLSIPPSKSTTGVYEEIIPLLKGRIAPPSDDARLWSPGQLGGSCSTSCIVSYIRSQLPTEDFEQLMDVARHEILFKSYREIKNGWGNTTIQKLVTLEIVEELQHRHQLEGRELPKQLQEMKRQLMAMQTPQTPFDSFLKGNFYRGFAQAALQTLHLNEISISPFLDIEEQLASKSCIDNLNIAFTILQENDFKSFSKALEYLKQAEKQTILPEESDKLTAFYRLVKKQYLSKICTKEQIYVFTVLSTLLHDQYQKVKPEFHGDFALFESEIHDKYNRLHLGNYFRDAPFNQRITEQQRRNNPQQEPTIPAGLERIQEKMKG